MFRFGSEVLITQISNAIERKEPVWTRFLPALLRWELGLGSLSLRSELSRDTREERMLSLMGWRKCSPGCPVPSLRPCHTGDTYPVWEGNSLVCTQAGSLASTDIPCSALAYP